MKKLHTKKFSIGQITSQPVKLLVFLKAVQMWNNDINKMIRSYSFMK